MAKTKIEVPQDVWQKVKSEYINRGTSIRELCRKYNLPYNQTLINTKRWDADRKEIEEIAIKESNKLVGLELAKTYEKVLYIADVLVDKLKIAVDDLNTDSPTILDDLKNATYTMKNLKDVGLFRASLDEQEQIARINKLRREAEDQKDKETQIFVTFEGGVDDYAD